jgi:hypothetical protein
VDYSAVERARERLEAAAQERIDQAQIDAALDRARRQIEDLAEVAAKLPAQVGEAVQDGIRAEALPVARQLAEVRGFAAQTIRRLERLEGDTLAERNARVDDLALLVDLITSGWQSVDDRLARLEKRLSTNGGAAVYRLEEARTTT